MRFLILLSAIMFSFADVGDIPVRLAAPTNLLPRISKPHPIRPNQFQIQGVSTIDKKQVVTRATGHERTKRGLMLGAYPFGFPPFQHQQQHQQQQQQQQQSLHLQQHHQQHFQPQHFQQLPQQTFPQQQHYKGPQPPTSPNSPFRRPYILPNSFQSAIPQSVQFPQNNLNSPQTLQNNAAQGKYAATKYYYPQRQRLPLPKCFHNPTGYVCCNEKLNDLIVQTYSDMEAKPRFHSCNVQALAIHLQMHAEKHFATDFETIVGYEDFAQKIHFKDDLVCKVELGGRYMLAYATVREVTNEKLNPTQQNSIFI